MPNKVVKKKKKKNCLKLLFPVTVIKSLSMQIVSLQSKNKSGENGVEI